LRRNRTKAEDADSVIPKPVPVSAGPIAQVTELAFNPSPEKIAEMTVVSRIQARLLPQLEVLNRMWQYLIEIASFRQDRDEYAKVYGRTRPIPPNLIAIYTYSLAQWQKSQDGVNLKSAVDLALAEIETKGGEGGEGFGGADAFKD